MRGKIVVLAAVSTLLAALLWDMPAYAHHSVEALFHFSGDKEITIEGTVVRVLIRNPHSMIHVEAPDANGEMQVWTVWWQGPSQLARDGIDRNTFRYGDHVIVTGHPPRIEGPRMILRRLERPSDGIVWERSSG